MGRCGRAEGPGVDEQTRHDADRVWKRFCEKPSRLAEGLNNAQRFLEYAGLVPGIGEVADVINAIIYLARGRRWDAALSFAAVIPVVGSVGAKAARKILFSRQAAEAVIKLSRDTEAIGKAVDELRALGRRDSELRAIGDGLRVNHAPPALPPAELDGLVRRGEAVRVDVAGGHSYYQTPHGVYRCSKFCQRVSPDNLAKLSPDTGGGLGGAAPKVQYVDDLVSPKRRTHILDGDATGGGHRFGTGKPGKTEFPKSWPDERVLHEITDVVTDPNARAVQLTGKGTGTVYQGKDIPLNLTTKSGKPVRFKVTGRRGGVDIEVIYEPGGEGIVSGFPSWPNNSSSVVKNPG